jgi:hypothetical protein
VGIWIWERWNQVDTFSKLQRLQGGRNVGEMRNQNLTQVRFCLKEKYNQVFGKPMQFILDKGVGKFILGD